MPATGTRETRLGPSYRFAPTRPWAAACVFLALFAVSAFGQTTAKAPAPAQPQILQRVEAQAQAYKQSIARIPLQVQETVSDYDSTGHLKHTRHSTYRYTFEAAESKTGKDKGSAGDKQEETLRGAVLSDGVTLPFIFLPGSVSHLSIRAETPKDGPWVLHFKSTPCPPPKLHRHWMGTDIQSQCVEGRAFLDPNDATITRIRMDMADLPVSFRSFPIPVETEVYELYNDASFRLRKTDPGAPPQLVPEKARYVIFTSRGRTVVERVFQVVTPEPKPQGPPSP